MWSVDWLKVCLWAAFVAGIFAAIGYLRSPSAPIPVPAKVEPLPPAEIEIIKKPEPPPPQPKIPIPLRPKSWVPKPPNPSAYCAAVPAVAYQYPPDVVIAYAKKQRITAAQMEVLRKCIGA